jgi:serine protease
MQAAGSAPRRAGNAQRVAALAAIALGLASCEKPADGQTVGTAATPGAPVPLFTCRNGAGPRLRAAIGQPTTESDETVAATIDADFAAANAARDAWRDRTFEEYLQSLRRECGPGGKYLVNGDVAIADVKLLREFFEERIQGEPAAPPAKELVDGHALSRSRLTLALRGGAEAIWTTPQKRALTYCVGAAFGAQHDKVVADMEAATGAWEQVASVDFSHVASEDARCDAANDSVTFDVNPVDVGGDYLARAFFPGEPRADRNVYVDLMALALDPAQDLQLAGVLRHELGHALGFRHEHTRPESGACFEDADFRPITAYDRLSVMHYPQCNGGTSWKLLLTDRDKSGAACVYGAAPGFSVDPAICTERRSPAPPAGAPVVNSFPDQRVTRAALREYGPFTAKPGSLVRVSMRPRGARPGDPDVYVRLGRKPVVQPPAFTCRPFLTGALETCEIDAGVPPNNLVRVLVHGYTAGSYDLEVSFVPLTP